MTNVAYNTNIPFASNSPSQDQPRMQENTNSLKSLIEFDHVGFGENQGGYHTVIHEATQTSVTTIAGVNQIFSGIPGTLVVDAVATPFIPSNGDTQLYSLSGQGGLSQLTGNSAAVNGFQWIGECLLQWGRYNATTTGATIPFNETFPTAVLNIQVSLNFAIALPAAATVIVDQSVPPTTSGFNYKSTASGLATFIYWTAIGH